MISIKSGSRPITSRIASAKARAKSCTGILHRRGADYLSIFVRASTKSEKTVEKDRNYRNSPNKLRNIAVIPAKAGMTALSATSLLKRRQRPAEEIQ
jgi:hypothetical protein